MDVLPTTGPFGAGPPVPGSSVITIVSPAEALRVSVNDMSLPPLNETTLPTFAIGATDRTSASLTSPRSEMFQTASAITANPSTGTATAEKRGHHDQRRSDGAPGGALGTTSGPIASSSRSRSS